MPVSSQLSVLESPCRLSVPEKMQVKVSVAIKIGAQGPCLTTTQSVYLFL
jgi:hypothetical protein